MNNLLQKLVLGSSVAALAASMPMGAFAQDSSDIEQVVVSASRITIAGYSQPTPVTVIGAAQLEQDGYPNIEDTIRQMPQLQDPASNYGQNQASGQGGTSGASLINLRDLGGSRTLVLFDGQRVISVAPLAGGGADVNSLPPIMIQRVDIVTGGASASWGSDAIAGVVDFVTNKNFNGFKATLDGSDTTNNLYRTFAGQAAWGGDFDGGRGHFQLATKVQFDPDTDLLSQQNWYRDAYWVSNPAYAAGNGQPQLIVASNVGLATQTPGGIINASPAGVAGPGVTAAAANALRGIQFTGAGIPQIVNYGNLTLNTLSNGGSLNQIDGSSNDAVIGEPSNAYTFYGYGRYKLTDTVVASVTANYNYFTGKSQSSDAAQSALTIRSDNAYIPASVAATMAAGGITSFTLGTLNINNFNNTNATGNGYYNREEQSIGLPVYFSRRNTMRGIFNLDGTLGDDWSWNAYIEHEETRNSAHADTTNTSNLLAAEDAVTVTTANVGKSGLALGSIACRSTLTGTLPVNPANGVAADPGCIPLDVFGTGVASSAASGYVDGISTGNPNYTKMQGEEDVMEGSLQGTLPWQLPAGKVAVAFGMGWRKEQGAEQAPAGARYSAYAASDGTTIPGSQYNVIEGFGEINAPILKNNFVNSLDIDLAGRMTSYSTSGLVETWKLGATAQVNDDIKLRTIWSTDIRAPQLSDLFSPGGISNDTVKDPKSQATVTAAIITVGNPCLLPEVSHTVSGGVVLTPTFLPGLTLSADWYNISVTGEITSLAYATVVNQCNATLPSTIHPGTQGNPNDPLCADLVFNGPGGTVSQVNLGEINISSQTVSGLDLAANYTMDFWEGTLNWATTDSYIDEDTVNTPGQAPDDEIGASGYTQPIGPKWKGIVSATYNTGPYSFTVQSRWFGTWVTSQVGNTGNQATAATANLYDPANFEIPMVAYLDLRFNYKWNDNISFFGAVDNALDTPPALTPNLSVGPAVGQTQFYNTLPFDYDMIGRVVRAGVRFNY